MPGKSNNGSIGLALVRLACALLLCLASSARSQTVVSPPLSQVFNAGQVLAMVVQGDGKVIVGGSFAYVNGVRRNFIARFNADGSLDTGWDPAANGNVRALALDGNGDLYVGGDFTSIGGQSRNHLAKISTAGTGTADATWNPNVGPNINLFTTWVSALAVDGSGNLFVGGQFDSLGGQSRNRIAKVTTAGAGAADPAWNPNASEEVVTLSHDGASSVYAGGHFTNIGGLTRNGIARLSASGAGAADAGWNPDTDNFGTPGQVRVLKLDGAGNLYAGGVFQTIGGQSRSNLARLSTATGLSDAWNPGPNAATYSLALDGASVYVGGFFSTIGGQNPRRGVAKLSSAGTGAADATWNPDAFLVYALATSANHVYVGGQFLSIGGQAKFAFAAVDKASGAASPAWPNVFSPGTIFAMTRDSSGRMIIGGTFSIMGDLTTRRSNLARFNADGSLDAAWNPPSALQVTAVAADTAGYVYAASAFALARFSGSGSGAVDATWQPNPNGPVYALAAESGGALYAGGLFSTIGGLTRHGIAKLSTAAGAAADATWDPAGSGSAYVRALLLDGGGNLFVGGSFTSLGGQSRTSVAKLATGGSGAADPSWNPTVDFDVWALQADGSNLYMGGIGGFYNSSTAQYSSCLAKASRAGNGTVDATWNPIPNSSACQVAALALDGLGSLYAAGFFHNIGGQSRHSLGKISVAGTGAADPSWNPSISLGSWTYLLPFLFSVGMDANGNVAVGGQMLGFSGQASAGYAVLTSTSGPPLAITSADSATFTVLSTGSFTVTATGSPTPTLSRSGTLPASVTFNAATGELSGIAGSGTAGSYPLTFTATNSGGTANQAFTLIVAQANQSITFTSPGTRNFNGKFPFALSASASSSLPLAFTSLTPSVCTVSGSGGVTMKTVGDCSITASQPGNGDFNAATPVTQTFAIIMAVPSAATITSLTITPSRATISFTPPDDDGGAPIMSYTATCTPSGSASGGPSASGATSPITVTGLSAGVAYACTVVPVNSVGAGAPAAPPGAAPDMVAASASLVDFDGQSMGTTSAVIPVVITNNTAGPASVAGASISGQFAVSSTCSTLAAGATCILSVTFSPVVVGGALNASTPVAGTLTVNLGSGGPITVSLAGLAEKSLVSHYYRAILNRVPDDDGKAFWQGEAARLSSLGANVNETWFVMAGYFFNSAEYLAANKTNAQFVNDLYNTFFNRPADVSGSGYWTNQITSGLPREVVLFSFMFSPEFATFTQGIFGNTAARPEVNVVMDFFRGILNRLPDSTAYGYWMNQLRIAQCAGAGAVYAKVNEMSASFIFNPEYNNRARNNTQYVTDMYYSFLRRGGDITGVNFWINQLNTGGKDRNTVRTDFLASPEFGSRVQAVINAGCAP